MAFSAFNFTGFVIKPKSKPLPTIRNPNFVFGNSNSQNFVSNTNSISGWTVNINNSNQNLTNFRLLKDYKSEGFPNSNTEYPTINGVVVSTAIAFQISTSGLTNNILLSSYIYQSVSFSEIRSYTFSFYASRRGPHNNFSNYNTNNTISLLIGNEYVIRKQSLAESKFTQFSGTYTPPSVGTRELRIQWENSPNNDSTICVTGVSVV